MGLHHLGAALLISGVTMLAVHQFTVKIIANKVEDVFLQYNILDALVGVFVVALVLILIGVITTLVGASKNYLLPKK